MITGTRYASRATSKQSRYALAPARADRRRIGLRSENRHRQIISSASLVSKIDEPPARCRWLKAANYFPEFIVFDHAIETVGADQKLIVLFQRQGNSVDCHDQFMPQASAQGGALRMVACFCGANQAHPHALLYDSMILGDLTHFAAPNVIDPAITNVSGIQHAIAYGRSSESGGHPAQFRYGQCAIMNFDIGPLDSAMKPFGRTPSGRTFTETIQGYFDRLRTRNLAALIAADPVGDRKDHTVLALYMATAGVLIVLAIGADIAQQG